MQIKYFYYISESKVRMLSAQFKQKRRSFGINPKVEFAGFSIGVDYKSESSKGEYDPMNEITSLLVDLRRSKLIKTLTANNDDSFLVEDTDHWHHGLTETLHLVTDELIRKRLLTYVVWKKSGRNIYFLVGAPTNILGEKVIESSYSVKSTSTQLLRDVRFVKLSRQLTFENTVLALGQNALSQGEEYLIDIKNGSSRYKLSDKSFYTSRHEDEVTLLRNENVHGKVLAMYCNEILFALPKNKLNLVFKIFDKMQVDDDEIDTIYLGSPLYTAFN